MQPMTILLVEDEPIIAFQLQLLLEQEGYQVLTATDAGQVTKLCAQHLPDMVILNFQNKNAPDGMALARLLRIQYPTKVLFITGARPQDIESSADFYAGHALLQKPFTHCQLRQFLQKHLP